MGTIISLKWLVIFSILLFSGCQSNIPFSQLFTSAKNEPAALVNNELTLEDILGGEKLVAQLQGNDLYLVDPQFPKPFKVYTFTDGDQPTDTGFDSFHISPSKNWLAWYHPIKGVIGLHLSTQRKEVLYKANDFLNTYPYFEFSNSEDVLHFIVNDGNTLLSINLNTLEKIETQIPYPYGNVFKISPDEKSVLFVSGYGQKATPGFLFTDRNGRYANQFSAQIHLTNRHHVFWAPDSSGVIMIDGGSLKFYSIINPDNPTTLYTLKNNDQIILASRIDNTLFILGSGGYWHLVDFVSAKEIARTPVEIAQELQKPNFIPWTKDQFLIEETLVSAPSTFKRLWLSDLKGSKKIVFEKYREVVLKDELQNVD